MKYASPSSVEEATGVLAGALSAQVFAGATDVVPSRSQAAGNIS